MKNTIKFYIISFLFIAAPLSALDGVAVIDMRTAVLSTQAAAEAFKALEEDAIKVLEGSGLIWMMEIIMPTMHSENHHSHEPRSTHVINS